MLSKQARRFADLRAADARDTRAEEKMPMSIAAMMRILTGNSKKIPATPALSQLRDRDLTDIGLSRTLLRDQPQHAPVEVPNDRT